TNPYPGHGLQQPPSPPLRRYWHSASARESSGPPSPDGLLKSSGFKTLGLTHEAVERCGIERTRHITANATPKTMPCRNKSCRNGSERTAGKLGLLFSLAPHNQRDFEFARAMDLENQRGVCARNLMR